MIGIIQTGTLPSAEISAVIQDVYKRQVQGRSAYVVRPSMTHLYCAMQANGVRNTAMTKARIFSPHNEMTHIILI